MKFYYFVGSLLRPFSAVGFFVYSHLTHTPRARVVLRNERGELLLVKGWLSGDEWSLPGGGVARGEEPIKAAVRELEEEVGIMLHAEELRYMYSIRSFGHDELLFEGTIPSADLPEKVPNQFEIQAAQWFSVSNLPKLGILARQVAERWN